ncbi:MAG: hypothetical protein LUD81_05700 [Clostridiales bacterium]|nr:hypothetical protein [Clostridiales bacterium]
MADISNMKVLDDAGTAYLIEKVKKAIEEAIADLGAAASKEVDTTVAQNSANLITSGGVYTAIENATEEATSDEVLALFGWTSED